MQKRNESKKNLPFAPGSRGCGKTCLVKYLARLLSSRNITFLYANCRVHNSSFKILAHLLDAKPRGYALNELWQKFQQTYQHPTVLILDEVDLISDSTVMSLH
jgi:Cdc6-like AAA superfamily ATPase